MKFATFERDGQRGVGLLGPDAEAIRPIDPTDLVEVIARFDALKPPLSSGMEAIPLGEVRLLAPIPEPRRNILRLGRKYREHADQIVQELFKVKDGHILTPDRSGSGIRME
jgi:Domain of unknown function (DUF2437)